MPPYTSLLYDVLTGNRSLFTSSAGLAAAFRAFAPLQGDQRPDVQIYEDDSWGPDAAVYVFFNNDPGACAVRDARRFALAAARAGLAPTRVPAAGEVHAG